MSVLANLPVLVAAEGGEEGGNFLVTPSLGLMIMTLLSFVIAFWILSKVAFPKIGEVLDRRSKAIEDSITSAERTKVEADELLEEYRARLREAREQADDIVARARKAADSHQEEMKAESKRQREEMLATTRKEIEAETSRAVDEIRREVADLTVLATDKVIRRSLDEADHRRLIEDALSEVDFSTLAPERKG